MRQRLADALLTPDPAQRLRLAQALTRIPVLATRDELTGLINRRPMLELPEHERQRCVRSGHGFCVALRDSDPFKQINDRHGHADRALYRAKAAGRNRTLVADPAGLAEAPPPAQ